MCLLCVNVLFVQGGKFVGAKEEEVLFTGDPVFGACDNHIEYGGKGLSGSSKGDVKGKTTQHCSAKFEKPMVPRAGVKGSVSDGTSQDGDSKKGVKSRKEKKKIISVFSSYILRCWICGWWWKGWRYFCG